MVGVAALLLPPTSVSGQDVDWRVPFTAGEEARRAGNAEAYARNMVAAVEAMPPGALNRPFAQYHAARAFAMGGDGEAALRYLAMAWEEGIESLMISFADFDPAFQEVRDSPGYAELMSRAEALALTVTPLGGSTFLLNGAGAQLVASVGPDGVLLVDTGYRAALPAVERAVRTLHGDGIDLLVITHPHEDHWGGAEALATRARVVAHPGTLSAMAEPYEFMEGVVLPPRSQALRDAVTAMEGGTLPFNGEEVRIVPFPAHTEGDVVVVFPGSKVVHMGDAYLGGNPMMFPGTADPDGFLDRMETLLGSLPEGTVAVGGHDEPVPVETVLAQIAESRACMAWVRDMLAQGLTREEAIDGAPGRFPGPWVAFFYGALGSPSAP